MKSQQFYTQYIGKVQTMLCVYNLQCDIDVCTPELLHLAIRRNCITLLVPAHFHVEMRYEPVSFLLSRPKRFHCINVSPFSASMRLFSISNSGHWGVWKIFSSKSRKIRMVDCPELRDSATYKLKRLNNFESSACRFCGWKQGKKGQVVVHLLPIHPPSNAVERRYR